jgi:hypothetical protein
VYEGECVTVHVYECEWVCDRVYVSVSLCVLTVQGRMETQLCGCRPCPTEGRTCRSRGGSVGCCPPCWRWLTGLFTAALPCGTGCSWWAGLWHCHLSRMHPFTGADQMTRWMDGFMVTLLCPLCASKAKNGWCSKAHL